MKIGGRLGRLDQFCFEIGGSLGRGYQFCFEIEGGWGRFGPEVHASHTIWW